MQIFKKKKKELSNHWDKNILCQGWFKVENLSASWHRRRKVVTAMPVGFPLAWFRAWAVERDSHGSVDSCFSALRPPDTASYSCTWLLLLAEVLQVWIQTAKARLPDELKCKLPKPTGAWEPSGKGWPSFCIWCASNRKSFPLSPWVAQGVWKSALGAGTRKPKTGVALLHNFLFVYDWHA